MAPTSSDTGCAPTSSRRVNTHSGSTGSAARRSTRTKTTSNTQPADERRRCSIGELHAQACPPSSSPRMSSAQPAVSRTGAGVVDRCWRARPLSRAKCADQHHGREQAERDVDEEDPPPATGTRRTPRRASGRPPPTCPRRWPGSPGPWPARRACRCRRRWSCSSAGRPRRPDPAPRGTRSARACSRRTRTGPSRRRNRPMPSSITGLRPTVSASLP